MTKLRSLAALSQIARSAEVPGLSDPNGAETVKIVDAKRAEFRARVRVEEDDSLIDWLYAPSTSPIVAPELCERIFADIRASFGFANAQLLLVGSAQCGFSLAEKAGKPRYRPFSEGSDLDIAVVDAELFDLAWKGTYAEAISTAGWRLPSKFEYYFFRGWVRPDLLPRALPLQNAWFQNLRDIAYKHISSKYRINGGVYKDLDFLRSYMRLAVQDCRSVESGK